ncbi:hypothetical protein, partial [Intestinibacter sp.]
SKISKLPNEKYEINEQFKKIQAISVKIDKVIFFSLKILVAVVILYVASRINIYFGIGVFLVEIAYLFYKRSLKTKVVSEIKNIKNNINTNRDQILKEKGKKDISFLVSILLIGLITHFSWIVIISFCLVFGITVKDIYLNYKDNM